MRSTTTVSSGFVFAARSANAFSTAARVAARSDRYVMFDSGTPSFFFAASMNVVAHDSNFFACSSSPGTPETTRMCVCCANAGAATTIRETNSSQVRTIRKVSCSGQAFDASETPFGGDEADEQQEQHRH